MEITAQRFLALVAYDGSDFFGFQAQAGVPTIQGVLETALGQFAQPEGRIACAGRTDAGVHARGQVVAGAVIWKHSLDDLQRAWNAHLPAGVVVRSLVAGPALVVDGRRFHPRFSAESRTYRYTVVELATAAGGMAPRSPLAGRFAHVEPGALNVVAMQEAAAMLVGTHDFATFGKAPAGEGRSGTVRCLTQADWQLVNNQLPPLEAAADRMLVFTVTANAFLQHMVRRLAGTLLQVGRNRLTVESFGAALAARDGRLAAPPAFAGGLVLERVTYPAIWGLPW